MPTRNQTGNRQWPYCFDKVGDEREAAKKVLRIREERRPEPERRAAVALLL